MRRLLVAVDFSAIGKAVLEEAVRLAASFMANFTPCTSPAWRPTGIFQRPPTWRWTSTSSI